MSQGSGPQNIVVIGGGIAGTTTAYYLATHPQRPAGSKITVVEGTKVAAGASGYSGGFLAKDWHGSATSSLAAMSYDLHKELSDKFGGAEKWGYRTVETLSVDTDATRPSKRSPPIPWLTKDVQMSRKLGGHSTTAQVHPGQFTNFFSKQFLDQANTDLKIGHAVGLEMSTSGTQSQTTQRLSGSKETHVLAIQSPKSVKVKTASGGEENVPADLVVLAAGPWTGSLALKLLGNKIGGKLGVSGSRAHSIVLKTKEELTAHCLFTSMSMADGSVGEPEVYARPDGTTYICGAGDEEPLPPSADLVKPSPKAIAKLHSQAKALSPVFQPQNAETQAEQACFLPIPDRGRPLVGKVQGVEGVYIGSGLSCWGITQGPGTGKVLSEMILEGRAKSADISKLAP